MNFKSQYILFIVSTMTCVFILYVVLYVVLYVLYVVVLICGIGFPTHSSSPVVFLGEKILNYISLYSSQSIKQQECISFSYSTNHRKRKKIARDGNPRCNQNR